MVNQVRLANVKIRTKIFMVAGVPMLMAAMIGHDELRDDTCLLVLEVCTPA